MIVLSIDPSGNFDEGKGTTGYAIFELDTTKKTHELLNYGSIRSENCATKYEYWSHVKNLIKTPGLGHVLIEDYRLYNTKSISSATQSFSKLETPRLIGILEYSLFEQNTSFTFQMAKDTKAYSDEILLKIGILERNGNRYKYKDHYVNDHERMAIKHFLRWFDKGAKK